MMAYINNNIYPKQPAVMPPMPAALASRNVAYAARSITHKGSHLDCPVEFTDHYVTTGWFEAPASTQKVATMYKAAQLTFDLDFVDIATTPEGKSVFLRMAADTFRDMNITSIFKTSEKREIKITEEFLDDPENNMQEVHHDLLKAFLSRGTQEQLMTLFGDVTGAAIDMLEKTWGKPNVITFSGTGVHVHYWLADTEAWTDFGIRTLNDDEAAGCQANNRLWKTQYKMFNSCVKDALGFAFDDKMSDVGTALTRDIGSENAKTKCNIKVVTSIMEDRCSPERRLTLADVELPEQPEAPKVTKKTAQSKGGKAQPKVIGREETVTFDMMGTQHTITVAELVESWDKLVDAGVAQADGDGHKLKVRLDWLSSGSINCFCRKRKDGDEPIIFVCDVDKYLDASDSNVYEKDGKLIGLWKAPTGIFANMILDEKGRPKKILSNVVQVLVNAPGLAGSIRRNTRLDLVEVSADLHLEANFNDRMVTMLANGQKWFRYQDCHFTYLKMRISDFFGATISDSMVADAVALASRHSTHDPVVDWVLSNKWDGVRRLDGVNAWLPTIMGMPTSHPNFKNYEVYGRAAMLAIARGLVASIQQPVGCQHMLLLKGSQGQGKSTLASTIAAVDFIGTDYFTDEQINLNNPQDVMLAVRGKTVIEMAELVTFYKSGNNAVKKYISQATLEARLPYGRETTVMAKTAYHIGTTNDSSPLSDPTGNRRYLMVDLHRDCCLPRGRYDLVALRAMVGQLYAEAWHRAVKGDAIPADRQAHTRSYLGTVVEDWNLAYEEMQMVEEFNKQYTIMDQATDALETYLEGLVEQGQYAITYERIRQALAEEYHVPKISNHTLSDTLLRLGWCQKGRKNGRRVWEYEGQPAGPNPEGPKPTTPTSPAEETAEEKIKRLERELAEAKGEKHTIKEPRRRRTPRADAPLAESVDNYADAVKVIAQAAFVTVAGDRLAAIKAVVERIEQESDDRRRSRLEESLLVRVNAVLAH